MSDQYAELFKLIEQHKQKYADTYRLIEYVEKVQKIIDDYERVEKAIRPQPHYIAWTSGTITA